MESTLSLILMIVIFALTIFTTGLVIKYICDREKQLAKIKKGLTKMAINDVEQALNSLQQQKRTEVEQNDYSRQAFAQNPAQQPYHGGPFYPPQQRESQGYYGHPPPNMFQQFRDDYEYPAPYEEEQQQAFQRPITKKSKKEKRAKKEKRPKGGNLQYEEDDQNQLI